MTQLARFWSLTRREKKFLFEAGFLLVVSNICVKAIAFKHIETFLRACWNDCIRDGIDREQEIKLVRRSISRAANVLPRKSLCLSRSIAEFIMLRRRGIPAIIFAGVRFSGHSSLDAHAWVGTDLETNDKSDESSDFTTVIRIGTTVVNR